MDNAPFNQIAKWNPTRTGFPDPVTGVITSYAKNAMAKAYLSSQGPIVAASAKGVATAIGANGNIYCVTNTGIPMVFNGAANAWATYGVIPTPPSGAFSGARSMFLDSRGYIFLAVGSGGALYRSIDGGQTYAIVKTLATTTDDCMGFTEDNLGNLYAHAYPTSIQLFKSTDGGATWAEIAATAHVFVGATDAGTVVSKVGRHIHGVHWCKYRNLLFVSHGDSGSYSPILVSDDHGASFHAWGSFTTKNNTSATRQATSIVTDETAIYYVSDVGPSNGDYAADTGSIFRVQAAPSLSLSALLALAPVRMHKNNPLDGWSSNGGITDEGYIWFSTNSALNYSGKLIASVDKGNTWEEIYVTPAATGGAYGSFVPSRGNISAYFTGVKDPLRYGTTNTLDIFGFRVVPYTARVTGYDDLVPQWQSGPNHTQKLYIDFETLPTPDATITPSGTGSVNMASTAKVFAGTKACAITFAGDAVQPNGTLNWWSTFGAAVPSGAEVAFEARMFLQFASLPVKCTLLTLAGHPNELYVAVNTALGVEISTCCTAPGLWGVANSAGLDATIPLNTWFRLRIVVKVHATAGEVTVMVDDRVAVRMVGLPTDRLLAASGGGTYFGMSPASGTLTGTCYLDTLVAEQLNTPPARVEASIAI